MITDNSYLVAANTFPPGSPTEQETKSTYIEHAERRVIYAAARHGIATDGLTMVCTWAACPDCARAIVCSGIARVVTHDAPHQRKRPDWQPRVDIGLAILRDAGVEIEYVTGPVGGLILFDGILTPV
jgi:deoxycytidylate deaminase